MKTISEGSVGFRSRFGEALVRILPRRTDLSFGKRIIYARGSGTHHRPGRVPVRKSNCCPGKAVTVVASLGLLLSQFVARMLSHVRRNLNVCELQAETIKQSSLRAVESQPS